MNNLNLVTVAALLAGLLVVGFVLFRQTQASPVNGRRLLVIPALLAFGALQVTPALSSIDLLGAIVTGAGLVVGIALGVGRALTVRVWTAADGTAWTQGSLMTLALWGALIATRVGLGVVDHFAGTGSRAMYAEMLWMLFGTFSAQNLLTWIRARGLHVLAPAAE